MTLARIQMLPAVLRPYRAVDHVDTRYAMRLVELYPFRPPRKGVHGAFDKGEVVAKTRVRGGKPDCLDFLKREPMTASLSLGAHATP